jgi:tetratricopeptide (TPR) repeat protein
VKRGLLAAVIALLASPCLADDPGMAKAALAKGNEALADRDFDKALTFYSLAIELDPKGTGAWHERGMLRRKRKEFKAALEDLERAVEVSPGNAGYLNDLGLAKLDNGDLAGAIASYDASIRLAPDNALVWNNRAFAHRLAGDADGAVKDATMALQLDPKYARAYLNRGLLLYDLLEWEDALADLEKSVDLQEEGQDLTHLRIWILRTRLGRKAVADKALREWLLERKPGPDHPAEYARFLLGDTPEAEFLGPRKEELPRHAQLTFQAERGFFAGSKALLEGRKEDAKRHFESALHKDVTPSEITRSIEAELKPLIVPAPR